MIKLRIFSSFCDSDQAADTFINVYKLHDDPLYNNKYIVVTDDTYTHAIILNTAMPILNIPPENVLGLAFEPNAFLGITPQFIHYAKRHIGTYYIGDASRLGSPFVTHYAYMYHCGRQQMAERPKLMSLMLSHKTFAPGHMYRHILAKEILKTDLPIDIYGNGCFLLNSQDPRIKGSFDGYVIYSNYKYHICIENYRLPAYFSEKITSTLLHGTTPIYLGCTDIDTYFPNNVISLTGNINKDMSILRDICMDSDKYIKSIDISKVLDTIDFKHVIHKWL